MKNMTAKFTLFGNKDKGKTQTLKTLIYLLAKNVSGPCVINKQYHSLFSMKQLNFTHEIRVSFVYNTSSGIPCSIAICTQGDTDMIVRENWDFFLKREIYHNIFPKDKNSILVPTICISPCHVSDSSCEQEEFEQHMYTGLKLNLWQSMSQINGIVSNNEVNELDVAGVFNTKGKKKPTPQEKKNSIAIAKRLLHQIDDIINKNYFVI